MSVAPAPPDILSPEHAVIQAPGRDPEEHVSGMQTPAIRTISPLIGPE